MLGLAAGCVAVGLFPVPAIRAMVPMLQSVTRLPEASVSAAVAAAAGPLWMLTVGAGIVLVCALALALVRRRLLASRPVEATVTWDCGYARPSARMQYTASSYAQPLTALFRLLLGTKTRAALPVGLFPRRATFHTHTPDTFREGLYRPAFAGVERILDRLRVLQHGRIQLYVLYIVVTLIVLMVWKLG
jgi:hypothetical protein